MNRRRFIRSIGALALAPLALVAARRAAAPEPIRMNWRFYRHDWTGPAIIRVPQDCANIQEAINRAAPGSTIICQHDHVEYVAKDADCLPMPDPHKPFTIVGAHFVRLT